MPDDQSASAEVMSVLRAHGWRSGVTQLLHRIEAESDAQRRAALRLRLGRSLADHGDYAQASTLLSAIEESDPCAAGARIGLAAIALREKRFDDAFALLDAAERLRAARSATLDGAESRSEAGEIAHLRGTVYFHTSSDRAARMHLLEALSLFDKGSAGFARVVDTLGMLFAGLNRFNSARNSLKAALRAKLKPGLDGRPIDEEGAAFTYGSLARLNLDWGHLDEAEACFMADLEIASRTDPRAVAQIRNGLGLLEMARLNWRAAARWLDESIAGAIAGRWSTIEAFAHKDRARVCARLNDLAGSEGHLHAAGALLTFAEGRAHVNLAWGEYFRASGQYDSAEEKFQMSAAGFDSLSDFAWGARARIEEARSLATRQAAPEVILEKLLNALHVAEQSRRVPLIREIEDELKAHAPAEYWRRILRRFQGTGAGHGAAVLMEGTREHLSAMFMDIVDSTKWVASTDPQEVTLTLDEVFGEIESVCVRHDGHVENYLGDGVLVLFRDHDHERRSVQAALDVVNVMNELNSLRRCLDQFEIKPRIGIASGDAIVGFMGTYRNMVHNVIGATVNRAARLQSEAEPGRPCVSAETYAEVRADFECRGPKLCSLKGFTGQQEIWEVVAPRVGAAGDVAAA